jgi:hypothetical protein
VARLPHRKTSHARRQSRPVWSRLGTGTGVEEASGPTAVVGLRPAAGEPQASGHGRACCGLPQAKAHPRCRREHSGPVAGLWLTTGAEAVGERRAPSEGWRPEQRPQDALMRGSTGICPTPMCNVSFAGCFVEFVE